MPSNAQPIPAGLLLRPIYDFVTVAGSFIEDEGNTVSVLQDDIFVSPPVVFIDGILLTYVVTSDRRYCEYNATTRTLLIKNSIVEIGEYVQIFL